MFQIYFPHQVIWTPYFNMSSLLYLHGSYNGQEIKVRKVGAPLEAQPHLQIPKTTDLLTLREMHEIDPYEFPVSLFLFFLLSFLTAAKKLTM